MADIKSKIQILVETLQTQVNPIKNLETNLKNLQNLNLNWGRTLDPIKTKVQAGIQAVKEFESSLQRANNLSTKTTNRFSQVFSYNQIAKTANAFLEAQTGSSLQSIYGEKFGNFLETTGRSISSAKGAVAASKEWLAVNGKLLQSIEPGLVNAVKNFNAEQNRLIAGAGRTRMSFLHLKEGLKGYISGTKELLAIQARWYGARAILFAAVQLPIAAIKNAIEYAATIDQWRVNFLKWGASSKAVTEDVRKDVDILIKDIRKATTEIPVTFEKLSEAAEGFIGAGIRPGIVAGFAKELGVLTAAFPEIDMKQFGVAIVGFYNAYSKSMKDTGSEASKLRKIIEMLTIAQAESIARPEEFSKVAQYLSSVGQVAGFSVEQVLAMSTVISDQGVKIQSASRLLRSLILTLQSKKPAEMFEALGIEIQKDASLADNMNTIMKGLAKNLGLNAGEPANMRTMGFLAKYFNKQELQNLIPLIMKWNDVLERTKQIMEGLSGVKGGIPSLSNYVPAGMETGGVFDRLEKLINESFIAKMTVVKNIWREMFAAEDVGGGIQLIGELLVNISKALLIVSHTSYATKENLDKLTDSGKSFVIIFNFVKDMIAVIASGFVFLGTVIGTRLAIVVDSIEKFVNGILKIVKAVALLKSIGTGWEGMKTGFSLLKEGFGDMGSATWKGTVGQVPISVVEGGKAVDNFLQKLYSPAKKAGTKDISSGGILAKENAKNVMDAKTQKIIDDLMNKGGGKGGSKPYQSNIYDAIKKSYTKRMQVLKDEEAKEKMYIDQQYKIGEIDEEEHYKNLVEISKKYGDLQLKELETLTQERIKLESQYKDDLAKAKTEGARKLVQERYETQIEDIKREESKIETEVFKERMKAETEYTLWLRKENIKRAEIEIEIKKNEVLTEIELNKLKRESESAQREYEYGKSRISTDEFYAAERIRITSETADELDTIEANMEAKRQRYMALWVSGGANSKETIDAGRELVQLEKENSNKKILITQKEINLLAELRRKELEDMKKVYSEEGFIGVFKASFEEAYSSYKDVGQNFRDTSDFIFKGMGDSFKNLFTDVIKNELKDVGDYIVDFLNMVLDALADFLAKQVASGILSSFMGLFNLGGFLAPSVTGSFGIPAGANYVPAPRAKGGYVGVNKAYIVGENGRELFVPGSSGNIVSNNNLGGTGEPPIMIVNIEDKTGSAKKVTQTKPQLSGRAWVKTVMIELADRDLEVRQKYGVR